ncbi:hypothetical protein [Endozoicomonas sp. ALB091]|uniref:hypothetical protein n=1 Tax=Endozoicomonas sp. ALB091 TaxID=3403073 RepID=UPI003BB7C630
MLLLGLGIYKSSQAIDYIWRWDRVPQYIVYQARDELRAEFDGTIESNETGELILINDVDDSERMTVVGYQEMAVSDGDLIFAGDLLAVNYHWQPGPMANGLWMTIKPTFTTKIT